MAGDVLRLVWVSTELVRRLTSTCTRPATLRMSSTTRDVGGRVMRGVRLLLRIGITPFENETAGDGRGGAAMRPAVAHGLSPDAAGVGRHSAG